MREDPADEDELLRQVAGGDMRALEALYRATAAPGGGGVMTGDDLAPRMWLELSALAGDRWPAIRRAAAAQVAGGLAAELDRPPPPASLLHRERQLRAGQFCLREVA